MNYYNHVLLIMKIQIQTKKKSVNKNLRDAMFLKIRIKFQQRRNFERKICLR